jgi:hypothetical protein
MGSIASHARATIGSLDRAFHIGSKIFHATKAHIPPSKIKSAAEKGVSTYEAIREKLRAGAV